MGAFRLTKYPSIEGIMSAYSFPELIINIPIGKCSCFSSEIFSVRAFYLALSEPLLQKKKKTKKLNFCPSKTDEISREGLL